MHSSAKFVCVCLCACVCGWVGVCVYVLGHQQCSVRVLVWLNAQWHIAKHRALSHCYSCAMEAWQYQESILSHHVACAAFFNFPSPTVFLRRALLFKHDCVTWPLQVFVYVYICTLYIVYVCTCVLQTSSQDQFY